VVVRHNQPDQRRPNQLAEGVLDLPVTHPAVHPQLPGLLVVRPAEQRGDAREAHVRARQHRMPRQPDQQRPAG